VGRPEGDEQPEEQPVRRPDEAQSDLVLRLLCALLPPPLRDEGNGQCEADEAPEDQDVDDQAAMLPAFVRPLAISTLCPPARKGRDSSRNAENVSPRSIARTCACPPGGMRR
jgi:hypothetical protein